MKDVYTLIAYFIVVQLLLVKTLLPRIRSVCDSLCAKGLRACALAPSWPVLTFLLTAVVPAVEAMDGSSEPHRSGDLLKRIPMLTTENYQTWKFFVLLAFNSLGVGLYGLYQLYDVSPVTITTTGASRTKIPVPVPVQEAPP